MIASTSVQVMPMTMGADPLMSTASGPGLVNGGHGVVSGLRAHYIVSAVDSQGVDITFGGDKVEMTVIPEVSDAFADAIKAVFLFCSC